MSEITETTAPTTIKVKTKSALDLNYANRIEQFAAVLNCAVVTNASETIVPLQLGLDNIVKILQTCRQAQGVVYVVGNGGSAAIASHATIDLINMAKVRSTALLDPAVTTCISNDYGYEEIYAKQLERFLRAEDVLIAISSSGKSKNIIKAVEVAKTKGVKAITLSGFLSQNPLRKVGDFNLWLNSTDYGQVEIGHAFVLHNISDRLSMCH